jgi:hypothetical protein
MDVVVNGINAAAAGEMIGFLLRDKTSEDL